MGVLTILVDGDIGGSFREQATGVIHRLFPSSFPSSRMTTRQERWFSPSDRDRLSCSSTLQELLASKLPEARSCPGWGDKTFARIMRSFSARGDNVVCQDWSGLVALIPGLVRHALPCAPPPLLVAPESKVHALTQLVQCCAREMGMSEARISKVGAGVMGGTPEVVPPLLLRLLQLGCKGGRSRERHGGAWLRGVSRLFPRRRYPRESLRAWPLGCRHERVQPSVPGCDQL
ncbi:uncharacterized protein LOC9629845 [Selaginella moellendorffii]|uniref:uncharacterized protein LOC9629845 n=1 Tax=Selaginella moellendorffii TaxID=88036 RepID=UPI000D1CB572|nr:uncharacterized protein LOC9629845 [Selaginella moellendorffii]|eukprot:XP_024518731.1 uncharacterized protein LOC9629845 [Selaginella moellendorffii]